MKKYLILLILVLSACSNSNNNEKANPDEGSSVIKEVDVSNFQVNQDIIVTPDSISMGTTTATQKELSADIHFRVNSRNR